MMNEYIWKSKKTIVDKNTVDQSSVKMIDMSERELQSAYTHCKNMLYNGDKTSPGRYLVLEEIKKQTLYCNAELAVRWFLQIVNDKDTPVYSRFSLINEINDFIELNKDGIKVQDLKLKDIYNGVPIDYSNISVELFLKSCKDTLGKFNKSHITQTFIVNLGIWFSQDEIRNFEQVEKLSTLEERIQVVKDRLNLRNDLKIPIKSSGLSYTQFRSMINLKSNKKYLELTTNQLETLRDKVLFLLEENVSFHISQWETLMAQIEEVAEFKKYKLC